VARLLTRRADALPDDGVAWVQDLCATLSIPRLCAHGLETSALEVAVSKARRASSMRGNPIELTDDELHAILKDAL
jgi:alcohol dehydrogenase class IV